MATADADLPARVTDLAQPLADEVGVELVDVEVRGHRNSRVVKLVADAEEGLDVDRIAELSQKVSDALDTHDVIMGRYTLEVSSPGVDRPLTTQRDFRRNIGRDVRLIFVEPGRSQVEGTVAGVEGSTVTLTVGGNDVDVDLDEIKRGKIVLPW